MNKTKEKNKDNFLIYSFFVLVIITFCDQILKKIIVNGFTFHSSFLILEPHLNSGIFGGFLSHLNIWISRIFFSTLFTFIFLFTLAALQFLSQKNTPKLKIGLLLYLSGILGNVFDRALTGQIIDFIILPFFPFQNFAFNFADLSLAAGFVLIAYSLIKEYRQIWKKNNLRKNFIIDPTFQWSLTRYFIFIALGNFFVLGVYSFSFIQVYLQPDIALNAHGSQIVIRSYIIGMLILELLYLLALSGFALLYSHRIAGPIYIFQKHINNTLDPQNTEKRLLKFRELDYFKSLERLAHDIENSLKK